MFARIRWLLVVAAPIATLVLQLALATGVAAVTGGGDFPRAR